MNWFFPALAILTRMTAYGLVVGGIAGALALLTLEATFSLGNGYSMYFSLILMLFIVGGMLGSIFGVVSGLLSGFVMAIASSLLFRRISKPRLYKFSMGLLTLITTGYILFEAWKLLLYLASTEYYLYGRNAWLSVLVMSVIIAVYVSQIVARKYINEVTVRKAKVKV